MKIAEVKTYVVGNPPPHRGGPYFVFVKLTTNDGIEGIGEEYGVPFHPRMMHSEKAISWWHAQDGRTMQSHPVLNCEKWIQDLRRFPPP